jgi:hypothetical protein
MMRIDLRDKYKGFTELRVSEDGDRLHIVPNVADNAEDAVTAVLSDYPDVSEFSISGAFITGKVAEALGKMERFVKLHLLDTYCDLSKVDFGAFTQLKVLILSSDTLSDLSLLKPFKTLETLCFKSCYMNYGDGPALSTVNDVSPLAHLPKLSNLYVSLNDRNLNSFAELIQLKVLDLHLLRGFDDLSPLNSLTKLETLELSQELPRWGNVKPIQSLESLSGLANLVSLTVRNAKLKSLKGIQNMTRLKVLNCENSHIRSLKLLQSLTKPEKLNIRGSRSVSDITPLRSLGSLQELDIRETKVRDISPLEGHKGIKCLRINGSVADLTPITLLPSLKELTIDWDFEDGEAPVVDLAPLSELKLKTLHIISCKVISLEPLRKNTDLRKLHCTGCKLTDIEPIASLTELYELNIANNNINDLSALGNLTNLANVCIGINPVSDYSPIRKLPGYKDRWEGGTLVLYK